MKYEKKHLWLYLHLRNNNRKESIIDFKILYYKDYNIHNIRLNYSLYLTKKFDFLDANSSYELFFLSCKTLGLSLFLIFFFKALWWNTMTKPFYQKKNVQPAMTKVMTFVIISPFEPQYNNNNNYYYYYFKIVITVGHN